MSRKSLLSIILPGLAKKSSGFLLTRMWVSDRFEDKPKIINILKANKTTLTVIDPGSELKTMIIR